MDDEHTEHLRYCHAAATQTTQHTVESKYLVDWRIRSSRPLRDASSLLLLRSLLLLLAMQVQSLRRHDL